MGGVYAYMTLLDQMMEQGKIVNTPVAQYRCFAPGAGVEVWAQQETDDKLGHLHAHFAGAARMRVALVEKRPGTSSLSDGLFVAYFNHREGEGLESVHERLRYGDGTYTGVIPFVFSAPDYNRYAELSMPVVTDLQLVAFPFRMKAYETEDDWMDWQLGQEKIEKGAEALEDDDPGVLAGASFLPTTMLFEKKSDEDFPKPMALLSGVVLDSAILTNPATEQDFSWARIETAAGEMDLVVSPQLLEGYLVEGGVAAGECYLSGRLPEFAPHIG